MSRLSVEKIKAIVENLPTLVQKGYSSNEIAEELNISITTVFRYCTKLDIKIHNYHNELKFDNKVFDAIDSEEKAYWLGFIYADGWVSNTNNSFTLTLQQRDEDHLLKFNSFVKNTNPICHRSNKQYNSVSVNLCNNYFKRQLINLGCVPKKSLVLQFPDIKIFKEERLIYDFIRGYIDGDGCLTFSRNKRLSIQILGTKQFLEGIQRVFPNRLNLYKIKRLESNTWTLNCCGNNADFIADKLYKNAKIYLERKYQRFVVLCRNT